MLKEDAEGVGVKKLQSGDVLIWVLGTVSCLGDFRTYITCKGL